MEHCTESSSIPRHIKLIYFLAGPVVAFILAFLIELNWLALEFEDDVEAAVYQIETKVKSFEVALEGFANFIAISPDIKDDELRAYTQGIRKLEPDLYMFEIASRVASSDRDLFERLMRTKGYTEFKIHGFDYDDARQVTEVSENQFYYPIRFIEPESPDVKDVLGLDLASTSNVLIETMIQSLKAPRPVASRPFELLEGGKGYVIYRPAVISPVANLQDVKQEEISFAMLAVRGNDLLPNWLQDQNEYSVTLAFTTVFAEDVTELLIEPLKTEDSDYSLYTYTATTKINNESQPFRLTLDKNVCWHDLSWLRLLGVVLAGILFSFGIGNRLTKVHRKEVLAMNEKEQLYNQANFDSLTGLPNNNLLMDRVEQAIRMAERSECIVAIYYLDLDDFKKVNDTWGHNAGDQLLIQIASRLKQMLRIEDTVARIHGDEFVILLPEVSRLSALDHILNKLLSIFDQPFEITGQTLSIKGSIGVSSYPKDGQSLESLFNVSDKRMYKYKEEVKALVD